MVENERDTQHAVELELRSGIKIEMSSKGIVQVKVAVYAGETEDEVQRLIDLATKAYETTVRKVGASTQP